MTAPSFELFGAQHVLTLLVVLAFTAALPLAVRARGSALQARRIGAALGAVLIALKLVDVAYSLAAGYDWRHLLPLHLSDVVAFAAGILLLKPSRFLYELTYFWGMGGNLQALLTPALGTGFPHPDYWFFFLPHGLVIVAAAYATAVFRLRPEPRSIPRVLLATLVLAALAAPVNAVLGTNYLFLRHKPASASLLDWLGPWPWYILSLVPVTLTFLLLCYAPFWISDRLRARRR